MENKVVYISQEDLRRLEFLRSFKESLCRASFMVLLILGTIVFIYTALYGISYPTTGAGL